MPCRCPNAGSRCHGRGLGQCPNPGRHHGELRLHSAPAQLSPPRALRGPLAYIRPWQSRPGSARILASGAPGWSMAGCVRVTAAGMLAFVPAAAWAQASPRAVELPTIEVVESSPLSPADLDRDKVPANVQSLSAPDFDHAKSPDLLQAIGQHLPGVTLSDQTGNPFQLDLNYRGFTDRKSTRLNSSHT